MVLGLALLSSFIGIVQSILLRPYLRHAGQWSLATGITYWVGGSLAEIASFTGIGLLPSYALSIILLGPICGVWQSRILHSQIKNSGWWILAQTASWLALFAVTVIFVYGYYALLGGNSTWITPAGYALGGLAFGAVTASVLVRLLSLDRLGDLSISSGGY